MTKSYLRQYLEENHPDCAEQVLANPKMVEIENQLERLRKASEALVTVHMPEPSEKDKAERRISFSVLISPIEDLEEGRLQ